MNKKRIQKRKAYLKAKNVLKNNLPRDISYGNIVFKPIKGQGVNSIVK